MHAPAHSAVTGPPIRAISLDLDDTLWDVTPVLQRAESLSYERLVQCYPRVRQHYDLAALREVRQRTGRDHPELSHDFTALRHRALQEVLVQCGYAATGADELMLHFLTVRSEVALFADVPAALTALAARFPLAAVTNGNADINRIGLGQHFAVRIDAATAGVAKPDVRIFHAACDALGCAPNEVLHVGDHPLEDMFGARQAGLRSAWMNRFGKDWCAAKRPDFEVHSLAALSSLLIS